MDKDTEKYNDGNSIRGIVVAEKCGCCGHHEIGIREKDGEYIQLKPGMRIVGYLIPPEKNKPREIEIPQCDEVAEGLNPGFRKKG